LFKNAIAKGAEYFLVWIENFVFISTSWTCVDVHLDSFPLQL